MLALTELWNRIENIENTKRRGGQSGKSEMLVYEDSNCSHRR